MHHCNRCNNISPLGTYINIPDPPNAITSVYLCNDCLYYYYLKALGTQEIPLSARERAAKQRLGVVKS